MKSNRLTALFLAITCNLFTSAVRADLLDSSTNLFVPSAPVMTFNGFPVGTQNPAYSVYATNFGNITITNLDFSVENQDVVMDPSGTNNYLAGDASAGIGYIYFSTPVAAVQYLGFATADSQFAVYAFDTNQNQIGIFYHSDPARGGPHFDTLSDSAGTNLISWLFFECPQGASVDLNNFAIELYPGSLQVNLTPPAAILAGARFQIDNGLWLNSGTTVSNLAAGAHTLTYTNLSGWFTPTNQTVEIVLGASNGVTATYVPDVGALQVNLEPSCAVEAGAQWQLDNGSWQNSGILLTNIPGGAHILNFNSVTGWSPPAPQMISITANVTNAVTGAYSEAAIAGEITWIGLPGGDNNWTTPTNWDLGRMPVSTDIVLIPNTGGNACSLNVNATIAGLLIGECDGGGSDGLNLNNNTLTVCGPITVKSNAVLNLASGTLVGTNNTLVSGLVNWAGTTLSGDVTIATNGILQMSGNNGHGMASCMFTNLGNLVWTNDAISGNSTTIIWNYGLWTALDDQTLSGAVFNNYGILRKSGGSGNYPGSYFPSGTTFNQRGGFIDVQSGTNGLQMNLQGGGTFAGGYITTNTDGYVYLSSINGSGNYTIDGTVTSSNTVDSGGALIGTNVIQGAFTWSQGNWNGIFITITTNAVLYVNGTTSGKNLSGSTLTNFGTVAWKNDAINGDGGSVIYNYGLWNALDDQYFNGGAGITFNNYGIFRKSGGTGNYPGTFFPPNSVFNQCAGVIDVQSGTNGLQLQLQGGGNLTGGWVTTNLNGFVYMGRGAFSVNGTVTSSNTVDSGGALSGTNVLRGAFTWSQGNWNGISLTVATNSTLFLRDNNGGKNLSGSAFTNFGLVNWSGDSFNGDGGSVIYNYGVWNAQDDHYFNGGSGATFDNYGTFEKTGGTDNYPGTYGTSSLTFNQLGGLMNLQYGLVTLSGPYSLANGTMNFGINSSTNIGELLTGSTVALGGTLTATTSGAFEPYIGEQFQVISCSAVSGAYSHINLPSGFSASYAANGVILNVVGAVPVQLQSPRYTGTNLAFQFPTTTNQSYTVQQSSNLLNSAWSFYTNLTGNGSPMQVLVTTTNRPQNFFRVSQP